MAYSFQVRMAYKEKYPSDLFLLISPSFVVGYSWYRYHWIANFILYTFADEADLRPASSNHPPPRVFSSKCYWLTSRNAIRIRQVVSKSSLISFSHHTIAVPSRLVRKLSEVLCLALLAPIRPNLLPILPLQIRLDQTFTNPCYSK